MRKVVLKSNTKPCLRDYLNPVYVVVNLLGEVLIRLPLPYTMSYN